MLEAAGREWTIRMLGFGIIVGVFAFLLSSLWMGQIADPLAALNTLGIIIGFLILLIPSTKLLKFWG